MDTQKATPRSGGGTLHPPLCDLLGIDFPIIQAGMGMGSSAELGFAKGVFEWLRKAPWGNAACCGSTNSVSCTSEAAK